MDARPTRLTRELRNERIAPGPQTLFGRRQMRRIRAYRPSPAMAVALVALFVSLGGVSYGVATGSIDSREIKNNTVRTRDLRNNEVRGRDIRNSTIRGADVALNTLGGVDVNESKLGKVPSAERADTAAAAGRPRL